MSFLPWYESLSNYSSWYQLFKTFFIKNNPLWDFLIGIPMSQDTCPILISLFIWFRDFFFIFKSSFWYWKRIPTNSLCPIIKLHKEKIRWLLKLNVVWFFIVLPTCAEMISKEKRRSLKIIRIPPYVYFFQIHVNHQRRVTTSQKTNGNSPPAQQTTQQTTKNQKKQWHHDPPPCRPPAAPIF